MAEMMAVVGLIGSGLSAMGSMQQASAQKAQAEYNAKIQEAKGREEFASKQREAQKNEQEAKLADSRARAIAAASGAGGAETGSVSNTLSEIYSMGDYNARSAVFEGESMKAGRYDQAALSRAQGRSAYNNSILQGIGSFASSAYKLYG